MLTCSWRLCSVHRDRSGTLEERADPSCALITRLRSNIMITRHPWQLTIPGVMTIAERLEMARVDRLNSSTCVRASRTMRRFTLIFTVYENISGALSSLLFNFVTWLLVKEFAVFFHARAACKTFLVSRTRS